MSARSFRSIAIALPAVLIASIFLSTTPTNAAAKSDRFRPTSVMWAEDGGIPDLASPQVYEAAAQANPVTGNQVLFSRCRATGTLASYALFAGDVINGETDTYYADGTHCGSPQNEQNIVVNPTDVNNIVTSANDYRYGFGACWAYVSRDGGNSWNDVILPGWSSGSGSNGVYSKTGCGGDPVLAFSNDGKSLYFASLTYGSAKNSTGKAYVNMSGLGVAVSHDGGLTWSNPVMVDYQATANVFNDKEWIAVGNDGTVYLTWTQFNSDHKYGYVSSPIVFSSSKTGGRSWTPVRRVSDAAHPYNQGSQVGITKSGALIVSYEGTSADLQTDQLIVAQSRDGGATFTNTEVARIYDDNNCYPTQLPGAQGRQTLSYEQFRINSFPSQAIDPTTGTVSIVWADDRNSAACGSANPSFSGTTSNQVFLSTAVDTPSGILSFGPATQVTSGVGDKVYPSVGSNAGVTSIGYYTRDYSPAAADNNRACGIVEANVVNGVLNLGATAAPTANDRANASICLDFASRSSQDGFASETRLTNESSNPYVQFAGSFIGDYTGAAVDSNGRAWYVWTDFRGNPGITGPNQDTVVAHS